MGSESVQWLYNGTKNSDSLHLSALSPSGYLGMFPHGCKVPVMVPNIECKHNNAQLKKRDVSTYEVFLIRKEVFPRSPLPQLLLARIESHVPVLVAREAGKWEAGIFSLWDERFSSSRKEEMAFVLIISSVILHLGSTFIEVLAQASHAAKHLTLLT